MYTTILFDYLYLSPHKIIVFHVVSQDYLVYTDANNGKLKIAILGIRHFCYLI